MIMRGPSQFADGKDVNTDDSADGTTSHDNQAWYPKPFWEQGSNGDTIRILFIIIIVVIVALSSSYTHRRGCQVRCHSKTNQPSVANIYSIHAMNNSTTTALSRLTTIRLCFSVSSTIREVYCVCSCLFALARGDAIMMDRSLSTRARNEQATRPRFWVKSASYLLSSGAKTPRSSNILSLKAHEQAGDWVECRETMTGPILWYNSATNRLVFDNPPEGVRLITNLAEMGGDPEKLSSSGKTREYSTNKGDGDEKSVRIEVFSKELEAVKRVYEKNVDRLRDENSMIQRELELWKINTTVKEFSVEIEEITPRVESPIRKTDEKINCLEGVLTRAEEEMDVVKVRVESEQLERAQAATTNTDSELKKLRLELSRVNVSLKTTLTQTQNHTAGSCWDDGFNYVSDEKISRFTSMCF